MPLLPYERFIIETPLLPARAAQALADNVEPRRLLRFGRGEKAFEGEVADNGFSIQRVIGYRNSFLPRIQGTFERSPNGTRVSGTMKLHPLALAFMVVWMGAVAIAAFVILSASLVGHEFEPAALVPVGMFFFGWAMTSGAFTIEARIAQRRLAEILS